jgi:hypothetical protein
VGDSRPKQAGPSSRTGGYLHRLSIDKPGTRKQGGTCAAPPPTITWTPETYNRFKVYLGADPAFNVKVTSGTTLLKVPMYTVPSRKWGSICRRLTGTIYLKVFGKKKGVGSEYSETVGIVF